MGHRWKGRGLSFKASTRQPITCALLYQLPWYGWRWWCVCLGRYECAWVCTMSTKPYNKMTPSFDYNCSFMPRYDSRGIFFQSVYICLNLKFWLIADRYIHYLISYFILHRKSILIIQIWFGLTSFPKYSSVMCELYIVSSSWRPNWAPSSKSLCIATLVISGLRGTLRAAPVGHYDEKHEPPWQPR